MSSIRYRSSVYNNSQDLSDNALVSKLSPSRTFSKYKKIASPNRKSSSRSSPLRKSPLRKSSSRSSPNRLSLIDQDIKAYGADEVALKLEGAIRMQSKNRPEYANTMSRDLDYINKTY